VTCITEASRESSTSDPPRRQRQLADPPAQSPNEVIRTRLLRRRGTPSPTTGDGGGAEGDLMRLMGWTDRSMDRYGDPLMFAAHE
jgi:hypothetical protein